MLANFPALSKLMILSPKFLYKICFEIKFRSRAEVPGVRRNLLWEFNFGVQYAWTLLNVSLVTMYSVSCPLITPFGKDLHINLNSLFQFLMICYFYFA